jgi:hypothetical protein
MIARSIAFECPQKNGYFKDPSDPHKFYECNDGKPFEFTCPESLVFDESKIACAFDGYSVITQKPSADCGGKTGLFKDPSNPHQFHECVSGQMVTFTCPESLIFDETRSSCSFDSKAVTPSEHVILSPDCPESNGYFKDPKNAHKFIECINGQPYPFVCPENLVYDPIKKTCAYDGNSVTPEKPSVDCVGKTGIFRDPSNPHKFHECVGGQMVTFTCPEDLIFDANSNTCIFDSSKTIATTGHTDSPDVTPTAGPTQHSVTEGTRIRHTNSP